LERKDVDVLELVEHLVGMQAQVPMDPYTGLWARIDNFRPQELGRLIEEREAVRMPLMRTTVHLVSAPDALMLRPLFQPVLTRTLRSTQFGKDVAGMEMEPLLTAATALVEERPRTKRELRQLLGPLWPKRNANSMVQAVHYLMPLLQVPPRGVWGARGEPRWTTARAWLGRDPDPDPSPDEMVLRYLGAFGPAGVMDVQAWCGLTKLGEVVERLRPRLRTFRNEQGRELFDLPDAPRPPADTPAPVRFLPEYDNVLLSHADRSRFDPGDHPPLASGHGGFFAMALIDGRGGAIWSLRRSGAAADLLVEPFVKLSRAQHAELEEEAARLMAFLAADAGTQEIRVIPIPRL
jgi:hypothetical protein